ncbi:MAG: CPBP family glutamic-type intramembrane protease [Chitinophagaceae bacterium]
MKAILSYIRQYFYETDKRVLAIVSIFTAVLIFLNYHFFIDHTISKNYSFTKSLVARWLLFLLAFGSPYVVYSALKKKDYFTKPLFVFLLLLAPGIFSLKIALDLPLHFSDNPNWNNYWQHIIYWPLLVIITGTILFILWKLFDKRQPFYGIKTSSIDWKPYFLMLLIMVPLIVAASTQPDFLAVYPKLKSIESVYEEPGLLWWYKLLFELSYGSDFITIELFFRGFLILAFIKWAGKDAILPMACFYCTIHFGKPLGECISSYFGGLLLGIVVFHTRSILGGLIVHLGIAWMMELGGYLSPLSR